MSRWLELVKNLELSKKTQTSGYPKLTEGDKRVDIELLSPSVSSTLEKTEEFDSRIERLSPFVSSTLEKTEEFDSRILPKAGYEKINTSVLMALTIGDKSLNPWDELLSNLEPITKELEKRGYVLVRARWFTVNGLEVLTTPSQASTQTDLEAIIKEARCLAGEDTVHASLLTRDHTTRDIVLAGFSKTEWRLWLEAKRKSIKA